MQVKAIREAIGGQKALVAVSGGVDSTTSAVLTRKAIGENLSAFFWMTPS
jgi:GMP synthase (glutamine-hydrolyzing) (EC 6.3.5.2)